MVARLALVVLAGALSAGGCGLVLDVDPPTGDNGTGDGGTGLDATFDANADSAGRRDGTVGIDASRADATTRDAAGCPPLGSRLEIASGQATGGYRGAIVVSPAFYSGWRFEVPPCGMDVQRVGFYGDTETGRYFAAIVALPDTSSYPLRRDLTGADIVAIEVFDSPEGFTGDITASFPHRLDAGAYALVFGSGRFGAESARGAIHGGQVRSPGAQLPFTIRQSDGSIAGQSGEYRIFLEGTAR